MGALIQLTTSLHAHIITNVERKNFRMGLDVLEESMHQRLLVTWVTTLVGFDDL
jgi:hypothetical protein